MTVKVMTGKQVNFLKKLVEEKAVPPEEGKKILKDFGIEKEEDLYHLNIEQASKLIYIMIQMPDK